MHGWAKRPLAQVNLCAISSSFVPFFNTDVFEVLGISDFTFVVFAEGNDDHFQQLFHPLQGPKVTRVIGKIYDAIWGR